MHLEALVREPRGRLHAHQSAAYDEGGLLDGYLLSLYLLQAADSVHRGPEEYLDFLGDYLVACLGGAELTYVDDLDEVLVDADVYGGVLVGLLEQPWTT